jgi:predicted enzyme related to lactoylglutathione lyase
MLKQLAGETVTWPGLPTLDSKRARGFTMSLFKNVNVVSVAVRDWEQAKKFYGEVLGWPVAFASDEYGWIEYGREGEAHVSISRWDRPEPLPGVQGSTTLVLTVDNAEEAARELRAKGIRCDDVETIPGTVSWGSFYDPEGNRIQFASIPIPEK